MMKHVEQTKLETGEGNCLAACVASILEVRIEDVPQSTHPSAWRDWLADRNLEFVRWPCDEQRASVPRGYSILVAVSPRSEPDELKCHAVVCFDGHVVWDPHPRRDMGLGEHVQWIAFGALDASLVGNGSSQ